MDKSESVTNRELVEREKAEQAVWQLRAAPRAAAFRAGLANADSESARKPELSISQVRHIPRSPSKKFFHVVSEFTQPGSAKDQAPVPEIDP